VDLELVQSLRSVAYDGGKVMERPPEVATMPTAPPPPMAAAGIAGPGGPAMGMAPGAGFGAGGGSLAADRKAYARRGEELAHELNQRMDLGRGVQSAASASQLGDFFQYTINNPVNLPRQKSALLPIVNKDIEATRLSIYNPSVHAKFPMLGLKLKNTSGLHLMQGPMTVFEGSTYAGDARITDLAQNDERLISYAVDLGTEVEAKSKQPQQRLTNVQIQHGLIVRTDKVRQELTYTATNRNGQERTLWIEHPYRPQFTLVSEQKPVERTSDFYRFEIKLPVKAKESASMTVVEEHDVARSIQISNSDDGSIRFFINSTVPSEAVKDALKKAIELKAKLNGTRQELATVTEQLRSINEDQDRMRKNMSELPRDSEPHKRLVDKFLKQETEIEGLREQQKKLQQQELKDRQALDGYLVNLNVN
jgi:hypothetical protein